MTLNPTAGPPPIPGPPAGPPAPDGAPRAAVLHPPGPAVAMSRVTIVTPRKRVDLAIPSDLPLAHLLPNLLAAAGESPDQAAFTTTGWALQRVGGRPLSLDAGLSALGVRDGEVLYLLPRPSELPEAVFDDVADTIATGIKERSGRWQPRHTRATGLGATAACLVAGALALTVAVAGPPWRLATIVAGALALLLVGAGAALSRALGDAGAGAVAGYAALPYAFLAGLFATGGDAGLTWFGAPGLLAAFAVTALAATIAGWAVAEGLPAFFGVALASITGAAGAAAVMVWGVPAPGVAALTAALVLACTPLIPTLSFRLARLPLPSAPRNADELRADDQELDGPDVKRRAVDAERFATGLAAGVALVAVAAELLLLGSPGWTGVAMRVTLAFALLMRARVFLGVGQRLWLIGAGLAGLVLLLVAVALTGTTAALLVLPGLLVMAAIAAGMGLFLPQRRPTPFWGRAGDIVEFVLIAGMFPLALGVLDVYSWVRGLAG
ncbi:type VII secretion integral membrane protein EccD [Sphaerisporangium siamense]|uniref:Type VII secretion integral membrane protein EccD n=1 Tax=Sphaerisporangium siamense TaxID=795645 RepID=A0A7W7DGH4_9ACTN|nr:type VII secretion integral membrane protein EccD [Sphaerisporangium siamense]MBB4705291.1 type VII secretion integral membrane protein EccD [Sphaerisporangium siamense]GII86557.1 type VII secretion integral membrane protein EccD [Sphaerisporangium siamense]